MQVRDIAPHEVERARQFLSANGWEERVADDGFARAITDGVSNGYISMVVVSRGYRRRGIGRALVEYIMGSNREITWVLRASREGSKEFFAKLGFRVSLVAMEYQRGR